MSGAASREALDQAPKQAGWILLQIGHLYRIERKLRRQNAGAQLRQADRASQGRTGPPIGPSGARGSTSCLPARPT